MKNNPSTIQPKYLILLFSFLAALLVGSYIYFYQFSPLDAAQSSLVLNLISLISPVCSAIFATLVFLNFEKNDKPREVWLQLTLFIWLWTIAEIIWVVYLIATEDVPLPSIADLFWLSGFIFLTIALRKQYQSVTRKVVKVWNLLYIWGVVFLITFVIVLVTGTQITLGNYLEFFYAVADFVAGIAAIRIFLAFRGGLMSRPWIGLFVLGTSDAVYAWLLASGMYAMSSVENNLISLFADTTYMAAYAVLAVGFLATYLMLKHGPDQLTIRPAKENQ